MGDREFLSREGEAAVATITDLKDVDVASEELEILGDDNFNVVGSGIGLAILSMVIAGTGSGWLQMNVHHPDLEKVRGWVWVRPTRISKLTVGWVQLECEMLYRNLIENLPMWAEVKIRYNVLRQCGKITLPYVF